MTSRGLSAPFFLGCHWRATRGLQVARQFVTDNLLREQNGQRPPFAPWRPTTPSHSWSGPSVHRHQTLRPLRAVTSQGVSGRFLVGCQNRKAAGTRAARLVIGVAFWPAHVGQSWPAAKRLAMAVAHSCPLRQRHQMRRALPATTDRGIRGLFLLGCHSLAKRGARAARELLAHTRRPAQNGQPFRVRCRTAQHQTWSRLFAHAHQNRRPLPDETSVGVTTPFLVGCQLTAMSGFRAARVFAGPMRRPEQYGHSGPECFAGEACDSCALSQRTR